MTGHVKATDDQIRAALDQAVQELAKMPVIPRDQLADALRSLLFSMVDVPLQNLHAHDLPRGERVVQIRWLRETYGLGISEAVREFNRISTARIQEIEAGIRS